jgi:hypothetical protein
MSEGAIVDHRVAATSRDRADDMRTRAAGQGAASPVGGGCVGVQ